MVQELYVQGFVSGYFADKFTEATAKELLGTAFENVPLIGVLSQIGGISSITDDKKYYKQIMGLYI